MNIDNGRMLKRDEFIKAMIRNKVELNKLLWSEKS